MGGEWGGWGWGWGWGGGRGRGRISRLNQKLGHLMVDPVPLQIRHTPDKAVPMKERINSDILFSQCVVYMYFI